MAKPSTSLDMNADERGVVRAFQAVRKQAEGLGLNLKGLTQISNKAAAAEAKLAREAKRVFTETRTPMENYLQKKRSLNTLLQQNKINQETYNRAIRKAQGEYLSAGKAGKQAFGPQALSMVRNLAGGLGMTLGVGGAIAAINRGYETWLQNIREIASEANKASGEIIALAALQEPGQKRERVMEAAALAARYGVSARGEAFDTIQALQSALGGDWRKGMKAAETVFAATQVGIPVEKGKELEILGAGQGQQPGQALRRAYVAGQASGRDPAALAGAAPGLKFFKDKDFAFAFAAVLAGTVKTAQLPVYLKQAGIGLSRTGPAQERFEEMALGRASQQERLAALHKAGIDTEEELKEFGFNEIRQREALLGVVRLYKDVVRIKDDIETKAKPGIFMRHRGQVEEELPGMKTSREIEVLKTKAKDELAFGVGGTKAREVERMQYVRGLALRRLGREQTMWMDLIDEEGRATKRDELQYRLFTPGIHGLRRQPSGGPKSEWQLYQEEQRKILDELRKLDPRAQIEELKKMNTQLGEMNRKTTRSPTLAPAEAN